VFLLPATSFHPDFARLSMFRRMNRWLETLSGLFLFVVAGQQLLLWPQPTEAGQASNFIDRLIEPELVIKPIPDVYLAGAGILFTVVALMLAVMALYLDFAHRQWARGTMGTMRGALALLWGNLVHRITGTGPKIWPGHWVTDVTEREDRPAEKAVVQEFIFSTTLAAVSFAFGMWALRVALPGPTLVQRSAWTDTRFLGFIVLVFLLAGATDIWVLAIEVSGLRGPSHAFGMWCGAAPLYVLTTFSIVLLVNGIIDAATLALPTTHLQASEDSFVLLYRAAIGAVTLLIAMGQVRPLASQTRFSDTLRYGLAVISLITVLGFATALAASRFNLTSLAAGRAATTGAALLLVSVALVVFGLPRQRRSELDVHPLGAQLIVSPTVAVAPLLFNSRIEDSRWSEAGYVDLILDHTGIEPESPTLRVWVAGSEDEVAFEATNRHHETLRGEFDFVITDLRTAIRIMGAYKEQGTRSKATNYQIISVVATVPWRSLQTQWRDGGRRPNGPGTASDAERLILDAGYLRYHPPYKPCEDPGSPLTLVPHLCRPADQATVAWYGANSSDVMQVFLTEPYASWLVRKTEVDEGPELTSGEDWDHTYVLLARQFTASTWLGRPAVPYNWRRTLCEMIDEGQRNASADKGIVNHRRLHRLHDFIQTATRGRIEMSLEDLHEGLCRSHFDPRFRDSQHDDYALVLCELYRNRLLTSIEVHQKLEHQLCEGNGRGETMRRLLAETEPCATDDHHRDGGLLERYCPIADAKNRRQHCAPRVEDYLHTLTVVSMPDSIGQLSSVLRSTGTYGADLADLCLVATANLGDSAIAYMIDKNALPPLEKLTDETLDMPFPSAAAAHGCSGQQHERGALVEMQAFALPIRHSSGQLAKIVDRLKKDTGHEGVNIEQVFAFPLRDDLAIALIVTSPADWERAFCLLAQKPEVAAGQLSPVCALPACHVGMQRGLPTKRHNQQVQWKVSIKPGSRISFECPDLATWTPTWGTITGWHAEIRFDEVRLMVPTGLLWEIWFFGKVGKLMTPWAMQKLKKVVPGIAGFEAYREEERWQLKLPTGALDTTSDDQEQYVSEES
jgi:hypothetical protein